MDTMLNTGRNGTSLYSVLLLKSMQLCKQSAMGWNDTN